MVVSINLEEYFTVFFSGIAFTIVIICIFNFFYQGLKKDDKDEKFLMFGLGGIIFGVVFYAITGVYSGFYPKESAEVIILNKIGLLTAFGCVIFLIFAFERVLKTRYIFTMINIIIIILLILDLIFEFWYIIAAIDFIIILILMIWFSKRSSPEMQAIFSFLFIGFFLAVAGFAVSMEIIQQLEIVPFFIVPLLITIGIIIITVPSFLSQDFFYGKKINWPILSVFSFIIILCAVPLALGIHVLLNYELEPMLNTFGWMVAGIIFAIIIFLSVRIIRIFKPKKVKQDTPELLRMFTKPEQLTEEELTLLSKKKLCLVCKGKVGGFNIFICNDCNSLYCEKCARTLITLENRCWVCEKPIDKKKATKEFEKPPVEPVPLLGSRSLKNNKQIKKKE